MLRTKVAVPLAHLHTGTQATVIELLGGSDCVGRLAALGFTPGVTLDVVRNPGRGPIIVSLLDTQIALGRGEAHRVIVYPRNSQSGQRIQA
jgi:ferrous iron transport protein A